MKFSYEPLKLMKAKQQIRKDHPTIAEAGNFEDDDSFKQFVIRLSNITTEAALIEAQVMSKRRLIQLAGYIAGMNYYTDNIKNIIAILSFRFSDEVFSRLFKGWQRNFKDPKYVDSFRFIMSENYDFFSSLAEKDPYFTKNIRLWMDSERPEKLIAEGCREGSLRSGKSVKERIASLGIEPESPIGRASADIYLTVCERHVYIEMKEDDIISAMRGMTQDMRAEMALNILKVFKDTDVTNYMRLGYSITELIGEPGAIKYARLMGQASESQIKRYGYWLNLIKIRQGFGSENDVRVRFWSEYAAFGEVQIFNVSESFSILFPKYGVVEFTEKTMGPIYIYTRDDYIKNVLPRLRRSDNARLRRELLHLIPYMARIEHRGSWQMNVRSVIRGVGILYDE